MQADLQQLDLCLETGDFEIIEAGAVEPPGRGAERHDDPGIADGALAAVEAAAVARQVASGDAEIEVREYYELEDFGDSPQLERFRKIGIGE